MIFKKSPKFKVVKKQSQRNLFVSRLLDGSLLGDVDAVQELSDIFVLDGGALLDSGGGLGDGFDVISGDVELILHFLGDFDGDAFGHGDDAEELFTQEVSHFEDGTSLDDGAVDGEMGVGGSKLVSETESDTLK